MEKTKLDNQPKPSALPTLQEQMTKKLGRIYACKFCWHSYIMQVQPLGPVQRICKHDAPKAQVIVVVNQLQVHVVPVTVADDFFCHQYRDITAN